MKPIEKSSRDKGVALYLGNKNSKIMDIVL